MPINENIETWKPKDSFNTAVLLSALGHVVLIAAFTVKAYFFPSEVIHYKNAIKVDLVALPDKQLTQPQSVPKAEPVVKNEPKAKPQPKPQAQPPVPAKSNKVNLDKIKKQQAAALERLKAMQAIEKLKNEVTKEKPIEQPQLNKGNVLTSGDSLSGLDRIQFDRYLSQLEEHVKSFWTLPRWLSDANLQAQARMVIDSRGFVIQKEILISSGNEIFDNIILETIDKASPCPPPPDRLEGVLGTGGIGLNFP